MSKLMYAKDARSCVFDTRDDEQCAKELGITIEQLNAVRKYCANENVPDDSIVVFDEFTFEDGTKLGAGNIVITE